MNRSLCEERVVMVLLYLNIQRLLEYFRITFVIFKSSVQQKYEAVGTFISFMQRTTLYLFSLKLQKTWQLLPKITSKPRHIMVARTHRSTRLFLWLVKGHIFKQFNQLRKSVCTSQQKQVSPITFFCQGSQEK